MEKLLSTNHKTADQSKIKAVMSLVERSVEGSNFYFNGEIITARRNLNGLGLSLIHIQMQLQSDFDLTVVATRYLARVQLLADHSLMNLSTAIQLSSFQALSIFCFFP